MEKTYISRPFRETDLEDVFNLRKAVVGSHVAKKFKRNWQWHFRQNPLLKSFNPNSWVVEMNKQIVGYISVVPGLMKVKDKKVNFVWGGDLMSDPTRRGKGIGKEMVRRWKEEANICLALGVGDVAHKIERKFGWFNIDICKIMIKVINTEKFLCYLAKTKRGILKSLLSMPFNLIFNKMLHARALS